MANPGTQQVIEHHLVSVVLIGVNLIHQHVIEHDLVSVVLLYIYSDFPVSVNRCQSIAL